MHGFHFPIAIATNLWIKYDGCLCLPCPSTEIGSYRFGLTEQTAKQPTVTEQTTSPVTDASYLTGQGKILKHLAIISVFTLLSGCAQYEPRPVDLGAYPLLYDVRPLEGLQTGEVLSPSKLMAQALKTSPTLLQSQSSVLTARAAAWSSKIHPAASLSLTAEYSKAAGGTSPWLYGAALDLPTDWGQRRDSRVQSAELAALDAYYAYAEALWSTYSKVKHGLIDRHYADEEQKTASDLVLARSTAVTLMEQRVEQGEEPDLTLVRMKSDLAGAQSLERAAKARRVRADQILADALGVTADKVEGLKIMAEAEDNRLDQTQLMTWRREAVLLRKDVLSAVAAYDRSDLELRLAYAKQYPEVRLGPGYVWERGIDKLPLSVGLSLPPYDLNRAAIAEADARRMEAGKALETSQAAVLAAVDQAWTALKQAQTNRDQADQTDLPLARKAFGNAQMTYRFGETDGLDLASAKAAVAEASLSALETRHLASLAQADLEDALRRPFELQDRTVLQSAVDRLKAKP